MILLCNAISSIWKQNKNIKTFECNEPVGLQRGTPRSYKVAFKMDYSSKVLYSEFTHLSYEMLAREATKGHTENKFLITAGVTLKS